MPSGLPATSLDFESKSLDLISKLGGTVLQVQVKLHLEQLE